MPSFPGGQQGGGFNPGNQQGGDQSGISISAGDSIVIKDSEGNTVYSATGVKTANSVLFSSNDIAEGETYTLYINGTEAATATGTAGNGQGGFNPGGQPGDNKAGDVTGDGQITNADLILAARYVVNLLDESSAEYANVLAYADMNDDGAVSNADVILIARIIVGL
jgi:hypothetical protein